MYYFMNLEAGMIIDGYLSCFYDPEEDLSDWQDEELALHREVAYIASHGPSAVIPRWIAKKLTDLDDEWQPNFAKAIYLEAVYLYKGGDLPKFKASLKIALFDLIAGLNKQKEKV